MKILEWISKQRDALADAQPRTDTEYNLVTSRRAFLGLMAASAAVAVTSNPVIAALEHIVEASLVPYTQQEGYLEVLLGDSWWPLGAIKSLDFDHPRTYDAVNLAAYRGYTIPERIGLPNFQFSIYPEEGGLDTIKEVIHGVKAIEPFSAVEYKKTLRFSSYGVNANLRGAFIRKYNASMPFNEHATRVDIELSVDYYDYTITEQA